MTFAINDGHTPAGTRQGGLYALWGRLPLLARVMVTASMALLVSAVALLYVSARDEAQHTRLTLQEMARQELRALPTALLDPIIVGDFATVQQTLQRVAQREGIGEVVYRDMQGTRLVARQTTSSTIAPGWFVRWTGIERVRSRGPVEVGGRVYGTFEVTILPDRALDRIWTRLLRHLSILTLAIALDFVGIWLVLRQGLRPLRLLDAASAAIERGDYSTRVPVHGSPELRHVLAAFNAMAGSVEAHVRSLALAEGRVSAILRSIGDGLIVTDTAMRITYLNPVAESLTGWSLGEAQGRPVGEVFIIRNALTGEPAEIPVGRVIETGLVMGLANHTVLVARDGRRLHISDSAAPVRDAKGDLAGVVLVFRDVSEAYRLRQALEDSRARLGLALKGADLGLWDWDLETGRAVYDNRWAGMLGYTEEEIEPSIAGWENRVHPDDLEAARRAMEEHLRGDNPQYEAEYRMRTKQGEWRWILSRGRVTARDAQGRPLRVTGTHLDVHERRKAQSEIERLAFYDALTGLPNRRLLYDRMHQILAWSRRDDSCGAVLFIDLDHFKNVNDLRGHGTGDLLLKEVAYRLGKLVREGDTVARWGGDEFVVLLYELGRDPREAAAHASQIAEKLQERLAAPYLFDGETHALGSSIGICLFCAGKPGADELLKYADVAMYRAKEEGRNRVCFFEPQMQQTIEARVAFERDLRAGLAQANFELHLQPQCDRHGVVVGAEALIRWRHPQRGFIPPDAFIPRAESSGLIVPLGSWMIEQAVALLQDWQKRGFAWRLALNVSPRQFQDAHFLEHLQESLERFGVSAEALTLELTESLLLEQTQQVIDRLRRLKKMGVGLSLDDFGVGYSSLSYLKRLPMDEIKIDRGFVRGLPDDRDDAVIAETIAAIARQMRLRLVAEGVETRAQLDFLERLGCDGFQGYLFSRPLPVAEFEALCARSTLPVTGRNDA